LDAAGFAGWHHARERYGLPRKEERVSQQNKDLIRRLIEEVEKGNVEVIDELLTPDFVDHDLLPGQQPDREGYKRGLSEDYDAFSNLSITIEDQIAEGDKVMTRLTWRGTHDQKRFRDKLPKGKKVESTAIYVHRIFDGKVKEEWSVSDLLERVRQLDDAS